MYFFFSALIPCYQVARGLGTTAVEVFARFNQTHAGKPKKACSNFEIYVAEGLFCPERRTLPVLELPHVPCKFPPT